MMNLNHVIVMNIKNLTKMSGFFLHIYCFCYVTYHTTLY